MPDGVLIGIDSVVYDVSSYLDEHPGGRDTLLEWSGKDASATFHSLHDGATVLPAAARLVVPTVGSGTAVTNAASLAELPRKEGSHVVDVCGADELAGVVGVAGLMREAERRLAPSLVKGYIGQGSEDGLSLAANLSGFERYAIRPRVCIDVSAVDTATSILGGRVRLSSPVCVAPFAGSSITHAEGERAVAAAAAAAGTVCVVPMYSGVPLGDVRASAGASAPLMFQLYPPKPLQPGEGLDRAFTRRAIARLAELDFVALVVTVDTVNNGNREQTYRSPEWIARIIEEVGGFPKPCAFADAEVGRTTGHSAAVTWGDIAWLRAETRAVGMSLVLKGILTAEDTECAAAAGVDAVLVSNHGGRQLDGTDATIECVEQCVAAARGRLEVWVDGGFRRGRDVFKALALGARAVFIGRPALWALGVGGQAGVEKVLDIFRGELRTVMQLAGTRSVADISSALVHDRHAAPRDTAAAVTLLAASALGAVAGAALVALLLTRRQS